MLRKNIDRFLAAMLVVSIFIVGGVTLGAHVKDFAYAVTKGYTNFIKDNGQPMKTVSARINAIASTINRTLLGKDQFQKINLGFQMALGKQSFSIGGSTMVKLNTGQLYDLLGKADFSDDVVKMSKLQKNLADMGIPMLFVYPHSYLYEDGMLPEGVIDYNVQAADELVAGLANAGIPVVDSRDVVRSAGLTIDQAIYRTDQHWSTLTMFETFRATAAKLTEMGFAIDPALYAEESFNKELYPGMHMGQVGERLGPGLIKPDDFVLITPKYDTLLHKKIVNGSKVEEVSGSFSDLLNRKLIDEAEKTGVANLYSVYGNHDAENWFVNDKVPTGRILIVKDSYGTPYANLLALTAHETLAVDLRKSFSNVEDYARDFKPDIVVVAHSQAMLRGSNYVFVE